MRHSPRNRSQRYPDIRKKGSKDEKATKANGTSKDAVEETDQEDGSTE